MGLLLSHKRKCRLKVDAISFFVPSGGNQDGGGKRGDVEGFSRASRKRMIEMLHSVKFQTAVLITLTYGSEYPEDWHRWKANLKEWRRRTENMFGALRAIWRIELQKRGAPHFHILYLDLPYIPVGDLQSLWYDVLRTPAKDRFGNSLDLRAVRGDGGHKQIMSYVSKYIGKIEDYEGWDDKPRIGRIWGHWNVKEESALECDLYDDECKEIGEKIRSMWAKNYYDPDDITRCTLFGEEMGTGEFMSTVRALIISVSERHRGRNGRKVTFDTVKVNQ